MPDVGPWFDDPLPSGIAKLPGTDCQLLVDRYDKLAERRLAPSSEYPKKAVEWPRPSLEARAIPAGVFPLSAEEGFDHDKNLDRFFAKHAPEGIAVWGIGMHKYGCYRGVYNEPTRIWIRKSLIFSPCCLMAFEKDIVLIIDDQLDYSVIGATEKIIRDLENEFGGAKKLRDEFVGYVEERGVGFGEEDRKWAWEFLIPWCGWS